jgi:putative tryptophan/tyrosine transport system substrate-binding protein
MIGRRDFITLLGGAAAWPLAARAQQLNAVRRIGVLTGYEESDPDAPPHVEALREGLTALGWVEGRNIRTDFRWSATNSDLVARHAKELVASQPDVLLARTTPVALALKRETQSIPIVCVQVAEPIESGLVASLARPGGNITGFTNFEASMGGKWVELLNEIAPDVVRVAFIFNPRTAPYADGFVRAAEAAAVSQHLELIPSPVHDDGEIAGVLAALANRDGGGLVGMADTFVVAHRELILELAARHRLPAVYSNRLFVPSGGLMAYAVDTLDLFQRAASYIDRILKGASAGDLPVQQPSKFELAINLKTAKALGLTVSQTLLYIANEVIEL